MYKQKPQETYDWWSQQSAGDDDEIFMTIGPTDAPHVQFSSVDDLVS